jgi:hypothetical protein
VIIIPPKEEWDWFWPGLLMDRWAGRAGVTAQMARRYGKEPQAGLEEWNVFLRKKIDSMGAEIESGRLSDEKYVQEVKNALEREQKRLSGATGAVLEEQQYRVAFIQRELEG